MVVSLLDLDENLTVFPIGHVFAQARIVFLEFQTIRRILSVFASEIIVRTFGAFHFYEHSVLRFSHGVLLQVVEI
jgi:hypothetical protein